MSFKTSFVALILASASVFFSGCSNGPGAGGTSSIVGKVHVKNYDATCTLLLSEYYAPDEDIYIIYGDDPSYGDRIKTGPDGTFMFEYLREGKYKIYCYSKDCAAPSGKTAVIAEVEITGRKQTATVPDIEIRK